MSHSYKCWHLGAGEDESQATAIEAGSASWAAERFAEKIYSYVDHMDVVEGIVVEDIDGTHRTFTVAVDWSPEFTAGEVHKGAHDDD